MNETITVKPATTRAGVALTKRSEDPIVMEHVAGQTLRVLSAAPIAHDNLLHWSRQIAKALHPAHAAHIIHRDIKPDNIIGTRRWLCEGAEFRSGATAYRTRGHCGCWRRQESTLAPR